MIQNYPLRIRAAAFIFLYLISFSFSVNAQTEHETVLFNGITYYKTSGSYYLLDDIGQELIPISSSIISLKYNEGVTQAQIESFEGNFSITSKYKAVTGWYDYQLNSSSDLFEQVNEIQNSTLVELVEVCGPIQFQLIPNDPHSYETATQTWLSWGIQRTDLDEAWNKTTGDPSIVAAFIDTGVDWWQEDFAQATGTSGTFWLNSGEDAWSDPNDPNTGDGIDNDSNGFVDDWRGWDFYNDNNDVSDDTVHLTSHGTGVTSVACARSNNGLGIAGVAGGWSSNNGIKAMVIKVGEHANNLLDTILVANVLDNAVLYAAQQGADN